jgi:hypothetical protein
MMKQKTIVRFQIRTECTCDICYIEETERFLYDVSATEALSAGIKMFCLNMQSFCYCDNNH